MVRQITVLPVRSTAWAWLFSVALFSINKKSLGRTSNRSIGPMTTGDWFFTMIEYGTTAPRSIRPFGVVFSTVRRKSPITACMIKSVGSSNVDVALFGSSETSFRPWGAPTTVGPCTELPDAVTIFLVPPSITACLVSVNLALYRAVSPILSAPSLDPWVAEPNVGA